jgi:hypothetical protein
MKIITDAELKKDLEGFYERLQIARNKLANLPAGHLPYQEHKKREQARRILEDEINHVKRLIGIAEEALES